jgi:hypothetical protein
MRTTIRAIKIGRLTSNTVPRHSYSLIFCNSFKPSLLPGQHAARKVLVVG